MVRSLIGIIVVSMVILSASFACAADKGDLTDKFAIGFAGGATLPADSETDSSWYLGGNCIYGINKYLAIGAEAGYTVWDNEENSTEYGELQAVPIFADVILRYPVEVDTLILAPYVIGGLGVIYWDYDESSLLVNNNVSVDMDAELGIKGGCGLDYHITENIILNVEGSYLWSDADVSVSARGAVAAANIDTDLWMVNGGIRYVF
jgi:outer membrane protein W